MLAKKLVPIVFKVSGNESMQAFSSSNTYNLLPLCIVSDGAKCLGQGQVALLAPDCDTCICLVWSFTSKAITVHTASVPLSEATFAFEKLHLTPLLSPTPSQAGRWPPQHPWHQRSTKETTKHS